MIVNHSLAISRSDRLSDKTIVIIRNWLGNPANLKRTNKDQTIYVRRCTTVAVLFILILSLEKYHGEIAEQCPAQQPIYGEALNGFTFKTLLSSSAFGCSVDCHEEDRCQSYNYVIKQNICEMNNRTKEAKPEQFVSDPDRFYMKP